MPDLKIRTVEVDATKEAFLALPDADQRSVFVICQALESAMQHRLAIAEIAMVIHAALKTPPSAETPGVVFAIRHEPPKQQAGEHNTGQYL